MELSSEKVFEALDSLKPRGSELFLNEVSRVSSSLDTHFTNLCAVELDLLRERSGLELLAGLDFSDIYSFVHPFQRNTRHSRLVQIEITSLERKFILLPGTLAELLRYLRMYRALAPMAEDTNLLRRVVEGPAAAAYLAEWDRESDSVRLDFLAQTLLQTSPIVRAIRDGHFAERTLVRLRAVLDTMTPLTSIVPNVERALDQEAYRWAWERLMRMRPQRGIFNNKIDALNYGFAAGVSKLGNGMYLPLITCSDIPLGVFSNLQWADDSIKKWLKEHHHFTGIYNYSFVRGPAYGLYFSRAQQFAAEQSEPPLEFVAKVRDAVWELRKQLSPYALVLGRLVRSTRRNTSKPNFADVVRVSNRFVEDVFRLQAQYFHRFLDGVGDELERDSIGDSNKDFHSELSVALRDQNALSEAVRFSFMRLGDAYKEFDMQLRDSAGGLFDETAKIFPQVARAQPLAYDLKREPVNLPVTDQHAGPIEIARYLNFERECVFIIEAFHGCFSVYWPCGSDLRAFLAVVQDVVGVLSVADFVVPRVEKTNPPGITLYRASNSLSEAQKSESRDEKIAPAQVVGAFDSGGCALKISANWDQTSSLFGLLQSLREHDPLDLEETYRMVRVNTEFFDAWCDVFATGDAPLMCGMMCHWNAVDAIAYLFEATAGYYVPENDFRRELEVWLKRYSVPQSEGSSEQ